LCTEELLYHRSGATVPVERDALTQGKERPGQIFLEIVFAVGLVVLLPFFINDPITG
jgi:hypothetical protein